MTTRTVEVTIIQDGSRCAIPVPFDPKAAFGRVRAPVKVTLNGYTYRSTIARMGGETFIPLRRSHREAADVRGGDRVEVVIAADAEPRVVDLPDELAEALKKSPTVWAKWQALSYTHQREHVESVSGAKRPETRERRIAKVVAAISLA